MKNIIPVLLLSILLACCASHEGKVEVGQVSVGKYRVYYERKGAGEPVLLIHAGLQDHQMWDEQVRELSKSFSLITLDLPFHGKTTGVDTGWYAKDVIAAVMDSLGVRTFFLVGLSMGAAVAQDVALHFPQRVKKLVLISSGIYGYEDAHPIDSITAAWYPKFDAAIKGGDTAAAAMVFTRAWGEGIDSRSDSLIKPAPRYVYETTLRTLKEHRLRGWPNLVDSPKAYTMISKLNMPLLVIHGDEDLPLISQTSLLLERSVPGAKRVLLKGVAHMLNMEEPAEVNRLLLNFFAEQGKPGQP